MKKKLFILIIFIIVLLANGLYSQELAELQLGMSQFFDKINMGLAKPAGNLQINYYDVNNALTKEHTRQMQDAQIGLEKFDNNEEIIFCLNDGIYVQQADGSGRRQLIRRGSGYKAFSYPAWSFDGTKFAFAANRNDSRVVDLVVANADGSDPTVILTLNQGYYHSYIWSISWSWDSEYIMFTYAFDDASLNTLYVTCTIHQSGVNFVIGPGPDQTFCQYEPVAGSKRYAYIAAGRPFYFNTDLRMSNLDGSNNYAWFTFSGVISGFTHVAWKNTTEIYTVIRYWNQYPNKECILRVNNNGQYWIINISDYNASLWCPTVSPDRLHLYMHELYANNTYQMWETIFLHMNRTRCEARGSGAYPNWRQQIPLNKPILISPANNATNVGGEFNNMLLASFSWQAVKGATSYNFQLYNESGTLARQLQIESTELNRQFLSFNAKYFWRVQAQNNSGTSIWSNMWSFTTKVRSSVEDKQQIVHDFALEQNYPNPFNPSTTISYTVAKNSHVKLTIYNTLGQVVAVLVDRFQSQGIYNLKWDARNQPNGLYFYRLEAEGYMATKKMILQK